MQSQAVQLHADRKMEFGSITSGQYIKRCCTFEWPPSLTIDQHLGVNMQRIAYQLLQRVLKFEVSHGAGW